MFCAIKDIKRPKIRKKNKQSNTYFRLQYLVWNISHLKSPLYFPHEPLVFEDSSILFKFFPLKVV